MRCKGGQSLTFSTISTADLAAVHRYLQENKAFLAAITVRLAQQAASFDPADRRARLAIMAAGVQPAVLDNLRFWSGMAQILCLPKQDIHPPNGRDPARLADFAQSRSKALLSLQGEIAPLVAINQILLRALPTDPDAPIKE